MSIITAAATKHNTVIKGISTNDVHALRNAGFSVTSIARMMNISQGTVSYHLKKEMSLPAPKRNIIADVVVEQMKALRSKGFSNVEIAEKIGCSYATVVDKVGRQPEEITKQNRCRAQQARYAKKDAADKVVAEQTTDVTVQEEHRVESNPRAIAVNVLRFVVEALNQAIADVTEG